MTTADASARGGRDRLWVAVVVVLAAVNVAWNLGSQVAPVSFPSPQASTPLRLTRVHAELAENGETVLVEITVRNLDPRGQRGLVWWQLAPEPASPSEEPPWPRRAYESRYLDVDVDGDGEATFRWSEEPMVPPGTYAVHGWARVARGDTFRPSDGRRAAPGMVAIARTPPLLRHRPAPTDARVTGVDVRSGRRALAGVVAVQNLTSRAQHGWLRWSLSPSEGGDLAYWWRWAGSAAEARYREVDLGPGEEVLVDLSSRPAPPPGSYALRVTLELDNVGAGATVPGEIPGDDVIAFVEFGANVGAPVLGSRR